MVCRGVWKICLPVALVLAIAVCSSPGLLFHCLREVLLRLPFEYGGEAALHRVFKALALVPVPLSGGSKDPTTRICEASALYDEHLKAIVVRTAELDRAYVHACKKIFPALEEEVKVDLLQRLRAGTLVETLKASEEPGPPHAAPFLECAAAWSHRGEDDLEDAARAIHDKVGAPPLQMRTVPPAEVGAAFARAEVVRFDAKGLLPAHLFNTSWKDLEALSAASEHEIALYGVSHIGLGYESHNCFMLLHALKGVLASSGPGTLLDLIGKHVIVPWILASYCQRHIRLRDVAETSSRWQRFEYTLGMHSQKTADLLKKYVLEHYFSRDGLLDGNVNVRRLPKWTGGKLDEQEVMERIGLKGQVEFAHNLLWFGSTPGGIHVDIQDNLLVQISGESTVFVVPANCSGGLQDLGGGQVTVEWLVKQGRFLPYFVVPMKPGDGLAIPSNAIHVVASKDPYRIGMNFFIEPRFGRMRSPAAPANFYNYADAGFLSMRALWLKTIRELWDTGAAGTQGFVIHGQRQEFV